MIVKRYKTIALTFIVIMAILGNCSAFANVKNKELTLEMFDDAKYFKIIEKSSVYKSPLKEFIIGGKSYYKIHKDDITLGKPFENIIVKKYSANLYGKEMEFKVSIDITPYKLYFNPKDGYYTFYSNSALPDTIDTWSPGDNPWPYPGPGQTAAIYNFKFELLQGEAKDLDYIGFLIKDIDTYYSGATYLGQNFEGEGVRIDPKLFAEVYYSPNHLYNIDETNGLYQINRYIATNQYIDEGDGPKQFRTGSLYVQFTTDRR